MDEESLYIPLDREAAEIRLLTLELDSSDENSSIKISMEQVPLSESSGKYLALSYTWGEAAADKSIAINGKEFKIRENLHDFLLRYRECMIAIRDGQEPFETVELSDHYRLGLSMGIFQEDGLKYSEMGRPNWEGNFPIWIDAICLNQTDVEELNDNVPRMKDIYESAHGVIVWLGNETETTKEAMIFLQEARMQFGQDRQITNMASIFGLPEARLGDAPDMEDWKAAAQLFDHPYWKRMWVVQELAFSFRSAYIWCGKRQMHTHSLTKVQRAYFGDNLGDTGVRDNTHPRYDPAENVPESLVRAGPWPMEAVYDLAKSPHKLANGGVSSREIMSIIRTRKAKNPRDMIYAVYSLIVQDPDRSLKVDYDRSVAQVFCDYMEFEFAQSKSLQIWQMLTEKPSKIDGLPSWAIDWTDQDQRHRYIHIKSAKNPEALEEASRGIAVTNFASMRNQYLLPPKPDVNFAAGSTSAKIRIVESGKKIAVTGYEIGRIDSTTYKCIDGPDDDQGMFWEDIDDAVSKLRELDLTDLEKVLQVGSCLLFDSRIQYTKPSDPTFSKWCADKLLDIVFTVSNASPCFGVHWHNTMDKIMLSCFDEDKVDKVPLERIQGQSRESLYAPFRRLVKQTIWDRGWIINKKFNRLGLAPMRAKVGDLLFVPQGCPFVMVFHDEGDGTFSVIGTCWLFGFMHGEAVKMHEEGLLEEKEIVLV